MKTKPATPRDDLRARIDLLEQQLAVWQQRTKIALGFACAALLVCVALGATAIRRNIFRLGYAELHTQRLVIDGPDGAARARLESTSDGARLTLNGPGANAGSVLLDAANDRTSVNLSTSGADAPFLLLEAAAAGNQPRAGMHAAVQPHGTWATVGADALNASVDLHDDRAENGSASAAILQAHSQGTNMNLTERGPASSSVRMQVSAATGDVVIAHAEPAAQTSVSLSANSQAHFDATHAGAGNVQHAASVYASADAALVGVREPRQGFAGLTANGRGVSVSTDDGRNRRWNSP